MFLAQHLSQIRSVKTKHHPLNPPPITHLRLKEHYPPQVIVRRVMVCTAMLTNRTSKEYPSSQQAYAPCVIGTKSSSIHWLGSGMLPRTSQSFLEALVEPAPPPGSCSSSKPKLEHGLLQSPRNYAWSSQLPSLFWSLHAGRGLGFRLGMGIGIGVDVCVDTPIESSGIHWFRR